MHLKISSKLGGLIALLLGALMVVGGFGMWSLSASEARSAKGLQQSRELLQAIDLTRAAQVSFKIQVQEWKNILLRGHSQKDFDGYSASFQKRGGLIREELNDAKTLLAKLGLATDGIDDALRMHSVLLQQYRDALKNFDGAKPETSRTVDAGVRGLDRPLDQKIESIVSAMRQRADQESTGTAEAAAAEAGRAAGIYALLFIAAIVTGIAGGVWIIRSLLRQLGGEPDYAAEVAARIAGGDLTVRVNTKENDNTSLLAAMRQMQQRLSATVQMIKGTSDSVNQSAREIAVGNAELSSRTEEQASALEETAASMQQMTATVSQNAENAKKANELAAQASGVAVRGGTAVRDVVDTMQDITSSSKKIANIIGVIDGIAFQTNILALNAAVEAARAGEQGRGFAVVASEVRGLAQKSAAAAKEIKGLIQDSVEKVENGSRQVDAAGKTMEEVVGSVRHVTSLIAEIAAASQEQSQGIEQVSESVTQLEKVTQQNAAMVEQSSAAAASMEEQAGALAQAVAAFKVEKHTVERTGETVHASVTVRPVMPRATTALLRRAPPSAPGLPTARAAKAGTSNNGKQNGPSGGQSGGWEQF